MTDKADETVDLMGFKFKKASRLVGRSLDGKFFVLPSTVLWKESDGLPAPSTEDRYFDTWPEVLEFLRTNEPPEY